MTEEIQAIKHILATIFAAEKALRSLAPEHKWSGLGNLLGDYGECVAIDYYGFNKDDPGTRGYDAIDENGKKVEIKAIHYSKQIGVRGKEADLLLVLTVKEDGSWEEFYFGDFQKAISISNYSARDNKRTISLTKLKKLKESSD
tara:strand:+ start:381 stop:812 length:432 start_codon:yes stop_codon:yes gene_type:complete